MKKILFGIALILVAIYFLVAFTVGDTVLWGYISLLSLAVGLVCCILGLKEK